MRFKKGNAAQTGTATVRESGAISATEQSEACTTTLSLDQSNDLVVSPIVLIAYSVKDLAYPYTFHVTDEAPSTFSDMFSSVLCFWNGQAMLPFQLPHSCAKVIMDASWLSR